MCQAPFSLVAADEDLSLLVRKNSGSMHSLEGPFRKVEEVPGHLHFPVPSVSSLEEPVFSTSGFREGPLTPARTTWESRLKLVRLSGKPQI